MISQKRDSGKGGLCRSFQGNRRDALFPSLKGSVLMRHYLNMSKYFGVIGILFICHMSIRGATEPRSLRAAL
jgi:hypothetical protein